MGFEISQKRIDDLRNLVVKDRVLPAVASPTVTNQFISAVPAGYAFLIRATVMGQVMEGDVVTCVSKELTAIQVQHDDLSSVLGDPFYSPSYKWGEVPMVFGTQVNAVGPPTTYDQDEIYTYTDGTFIITAVNIDYLRMPTRVAFPGGVPGNQYNMPDGTVISTVTPGNVSCKLPEATHEEVVDIAVQIAAGDIDHPGYQVRAIKTSIHE